MTRCTDLASIIIPASDCVFAGHQIHAVWLNSGASFLMIRSLMSAYSGLSSTPQKSQPSRMAAVAVRPEPQKQSRTRGGRGSAGGQEQDGRQPSVVVSIGSSN